MDGCAQLRRGCQWITAEVVSRLLSLGVESCFLTSRAGRQRLFLHGHQKDREGPELLLVTSFDCYLQKWMSIEFIEKIHNGVGVQTGGTHNDVSF